jgi:hypothetical protein
MLLRVAVKIVFLEAQYQYSSSGRFIENASILDYPSTQIKEPVAVANQPSPVPCYKVYILLVIQQSKDLQCKTKSVSTYFRSSCDHYIGIYQ